MSKIDRLVADFSEQIETIYADMSRDSDTWENLLTNFAHQVAIAMDERIGNFLQYFEAWENQRTQHIVVSCHSCGDFYESQQGFPRLSQVYNGAFQIKHTPDCSVPTFKPSVN